LTSARAVRFGFGRNWARYIEEIDDQRVAIATDGLATTLGRSDLRGLRFLDVGCGSGLFSLAARRLGAAVRSFDYDTDSVDCTRRLRDLRMSGDQEWEVERGDALDAEYLTGLGQFDVVYAWGVLHHTGDMWRALRLIAGLVAPGGTLVVAIYNDQGLASRAWGSVKRLYNVLPGPLRPLVLGPAFVRLWGPTMSRDLLRGQPQATWRAYARERGMSPWRDTVDWVGGYPFEVARPEQLRRLYAGLGYSVVRERLAGRGPACNELVLRREPG
jgi:SAM-dependent methyltransferase